MITEEKYIILNTGAKIPKIGLGTWKSAPSVAGQSVETALQAGYRHIDGAAIYRNEKEIGQTYQNVFSTGQIKRDEVFITSKLWNTHHARADVLPALKQTLADLHLDYLDLYLMHWGVAVPNTADAEPLDKNGILVTAPVSVRETWEAMEDLLKTGLVKAIGVSNFTGPMLVDLLSYAKILPAVNQVELHPYNSQQKLIQFCQYKNIAVMAYSPLGSPGTREAGEPVLLEDEQVEKIAKAHNKSAAQVLLRWAIQRQIIVIPKSDHPDRIKINLEIFDFELSQVEMDALSKLDRRFRYTNPQSWWGFPYFD